ncbi:restriction endonuclease subunit S [Vibrio fluvialis]|nr:restriction endonuclease subunit S [Vibrio fluvialis]
MTEQMNVPKLRFGEFKSHIAEPKKLGQLVDMKSGNTPSKSNPNFWGGAIPWISASSMKGNVFSESEQNVTQLALENGAKLATKGSLLLLVRGSMLFNKVPVGFAGRDVTYNQDVKAINLKNGDDNSYLFYWFKANEYKLLSMVTGTGIGAGKLDSEELLSLPFHQPKPEEQQKIASFLSKVDEKVALLTEKKDKLTEYKKGVMQQLFNGKWESKNGQKIFIPPTLRFKADDGSEFPDWEEKTLGDVSESPSYGLNSAATKYDGLNKYIRITDIDEDDRSFSPSPLTSPEEIDDAYLLEEGDIVFARTGASVGKSYLYNKDDGRLMFAGFLIKFSVSKANPKFISYQMTTSQYDNWVKVMSVRSGQPGINAQEYSTYPLNVPCTEEQEQIANFLSALDYKINLTSSELEKAKEWKKGLLQQMFV